MADTSQQAIKGVYCYARTDQPFRDALEQHLARVRPRSQLTNWHDREILPGEDWQQAIDLHLNTANLMLLFISPDFMASDYCSGKEMKRALERHQAGTCRVMPILLRPTQWQGASFSHLPLLPTDARPVSEWPDRDEAFQDVVAEISRTIQDLLNSQKPKEQWLQEGHALDDLGRSEEALAAYEQSLRLDPDDAAAYYNLGNVLDDLGRSEEALAAYEQSLHLDPDDAAAYYNLGNVLGRLGRSEEGNPLALSVSSWAPLAVERRRAMSLVLIGISTIMSLLFLALLALAIRQKWRKSHDGVPWAIQDGVRVLATITDVHIRREWKEGERWERSPWDGGLTRQKTWQTLYEVTAEWIDAQTKQRSLLHSKVWSDEVAKAPAPGQTVVFIVDPRHPERSAVDVQSLGTVPEQGMNLNS